MFGNELLGSVTPIPLYNHLLCFLQQCGQLLPQVGGMVIHRISQHVLGGHPFSGGHSQSGTLCRFIRFIIFVTILQSCFPLAGAGGGEDITCNGVQADEAKDLGLV